MDCAQLIGQYQAQIEKNQARISYLKTELQNASNDYRESLYIRIALLEQEIDEMWESIYLMRKHVTLHNATQQNFSTKELTVSNG